MARETKDGWEAIDLTDDHKPTNPEEKARILQQNGRVERWAGGLGGCVCAAGHAPMKGQAAGRSLLALRASWPPHVVRRVGASTCVLALALIIRVQL